MAPWRRGSVRRAGSCRRGLEPVDALVQIARRAHPTVRFRRASVADLAGSEERWSGILAWYSLIHLGPDDLPAALSTLRRALDDEGSLLVSFFAGDRLEAFSHPVATAYRWPMRSMTLALERAGFTVAEQHCDPPGLHAYITAKASPA